MIECFEICYRTEPPVITFPFADCFLLEQTYQHRQVTQIENYKQQSLVNKYLPILRVTEWRLLSVELCSRWEQLADLRIRSVPHWISKQR